MQYSCCNDWIIVKSIQLFQVRIIYIAEIQAKKDEKIFESDDDKEECEKFYMNQSHYTQRQKFIEII